MPEPRPTEAGPGFRRALTPFDATITDGVDVGQELFAVDASGNVQLVKDLAPGPTDGVDYEVGLIRLPNGGFLFEGKDNAGQARVVADYVAGMTDRYAIAEHERLLG